MVLFLIIALIIARLWTLSLCNVTYISLCAHTHGQPVRPTQMTFEHFARFPDFAKRLDCRELFDLSHGIASGFWIIGLLKESSVDFRSSIFHPWIEFGMAAHQPENKLQIFREFNYELLPIRLIQTWTLQWRWLWKLLLIWSLSPCTDADLLRDRHESLSLEPVEFAHRRNSNVGQSIKRFRFPWNPNKCSHKAGVHRLNSTPPCLRTPTHAARLFIFVLS